MEQAAADSRVAMETADQSLTKREECVSTLQSEIRELQGTTPILDMVLETPPKSGSNMSIKKISNTPNKSASYLERFRESISKLEISAGNSVSELEISAADSVEGQRSSQKVHKSVENIGQLKNQHIHPDSSGVGLDSDLNFSDSESIDIPLRNSINKSISEMTESPQRKSGDLESSNQSSLLEYTMPHTARLISDLSKSPVPNESSPQKNSQQSKSNSINIKNMVNKKLDYEIHRPLNDSRVLQVILTPLKNKLLFKHTKSSMLRLKNSPVKDPTYGRECLRVKPLARKSLNIDKENFYGTSSQVVGVKGKKVLGKRKGTDKENEINELDTSKRRRVLAGKKKQAKPKPKRSSVRPQYNLRTRR